jgi:hypothetical protein
MKYIKHINGKLLFFIGLNFSESTNLVENKLNIMNLYLNPVVIKEKKNIDNEESSIVNSNLLTLLNFLKFLSFSFKHDFEKDTSILGKSPIYENYLKNCKSYDELFNSKLPILTEEAFKKILISFQKFCDKNIIFIKLPIKKIDDNNEDFYFFITLSNMISKNNKENNFFFQENDINKLRLEIHSLFSFIKDSFININKDEIKKSFNFESLKIFIKDFISVLKDNESYDSKENFTDQIYIIEQLEKLNINNLFSVIDGSFTNISQFIKKENLTILIEILKFFIKSVCKFDTVNFVAPGLFEVISLESHQITIDDIKDLNSFLKEYKNTLDDLIKQSNKFYKINTSISFNDYASKTFKENEKNFLKYIKDNENHLVHKSGALMFCSMVGENEKEYMYLTTYKFIKLLFEFIEFDYEQYVTNHIHIAESIKNDITKVKDLINSSFNVPSVDEFKKQYTSGIIKGIITADACPFRINPGIKSNSSTTIEFFKKMRSILVLAPNLNKNIDNGQNFNNIKSNLATELMKVLHHNELLTNQDVHPDILGMNISGSNLEEVTLTMTDATGKGILGKCKFDVKSDLHNQAEEKMIKFIEDVNNNIEVRK